MEDTIAKKAEPTGNTNTLRHFEFVDEKSSKFWEIRAVPEGVEVRFGRIGTSGQTQVKPFADSVAALGSVEKLVAEKLKGGYVEITG